jgi:hypothetical protein
VVDQFVTHSRHGRPADGGVGLLEVVAQQLGDLANKKKLVDDRRLCLGVDAELLAVHPASELLNLIGRAEHVLQKASVTLHRSGSRS